jgi:hypothetical protein
MNILHALDDDHVFGGQFRDPATWAAWRAFLATLFALPMTDEQLAVYCECTGRTTAPTAAFVEAWLVCGRRAGKSFMLALTAIYIAVFRDWRPYLAAGERATIMIIAADRRQARTIMRYILGLLRSVPMLARTIESERAESIDLANKVTIEIHTASFKTTRGYTIVAALCDEIAADRRCGRAGLCRARRLAAWHGHDPGRDAVVRVFALRASRRVVGRPPQTLRQRR